MGEQKTFEVPASSRIPKEWEISFDLNVLKDLMKMKDEELADFIFENADIIKKASGQRNENIDVNLLFKLYYIANEYWLTNCNKEKKTQLDVDKVTCTRRLRDACKKEINRRNLI